MGGELFAAGEVEEGFGEIGVECLEEGGEEGVLEEEDVAGVEGAGFGEGGEGVGFEGGGEELGFMAYWYVGKKFTQWKY